MDRRFLKKEIPAQPFNSWAEDRSMEDLLKLGERSYRSRLIVGTGKYKDFAETKKAIELSGAEIVTVAVRRVNITDPNKENLLDYLDPKKYTILPNTAGCYTAEDAVRTCRLARAAVMPLAAPIGSGLGIRNPYNIRIIMEQARVPVIVDAGVGTASDAAIAMEMGCDGVLMNTAIAGARDPLLMAEAMRQAVEAGRKAYLAGRIPKNLSDTASSPL